MWKFNKMNNVIKIIVTTLVLGATLGTIIQFAGTIGFCIMSLLVVSFWYIKTHYMNNKNEWDAILEIKKLKNESIEEKTIQEERIEMVVDLSQGMFFILLITIYFIAILAMMMLLTGWIGYWLACLFFVANYYSTEDMHNKRMCEYISKIEQLRFEIENNKNEANM